MTLQIPFIKGRLDYSGLDACNLRTIIIKDDVIQLAQGGSAYAKLPSSYPSPKAVQTVSLTSIVLDFTERLVDYKDDRLKSIINALKKGVDLPPLSVEVKPNGTYELQNGYHRFLACALLGFISIPVDKPPLLNRRRFLSLLSQNYISHPTYEKNNMRKRTGSGLVFCF